MRLLRPFAAPILRPLLLMSLILACVGASVQDADLVDIAGLSHPEPGCSPGFDVLVFACHDWPICESYIGDLQRIADAYAQRQVRVYVVLEEEGYKAVEALAWAKAFALRCPVVLDDDRRLARLAQAHLTPEVAVFTATGAIAYSGRIDDGWAGLNRRRTQPTSHDLRDAIDALLAGRMPTTRRTAAIGCVITAITPSLPGATP